MVIIVKDEKIMQSKLRSFHESFSHPVDKEYSRSSKDADGFPIIGDLEKLRIDLIFEEFEEVMDALNNDKNAEDILKELCDLVYVCIGFADTFGWDFDTAFNRVHESNMSKLGKDGDPIYRDDGKILKSDQYKEPILKDLV